MTQTVLITGATSGMGLITTKLLAGNGFHVFAGYRTLSPDDVLSQMAQSSRGTIEPIRLDVQDDDSIQSAVAAVVHRTGRLDALVNNAGYGLIASVEDGTDEEFIRQFDVNVFGVLRTCRAVLPVMRAAGRGVIVNIGSFLGELGLPLLTHYNASKYAVEGITDSLRMELADFGIRVHTVAPGLFRTDFIRRGLAANPKTTSATSPYADIAGKLLPVIGQRIHAGPEATAVAEAVLQVLTMADSPARLPVGEEAVAAQQWKRTLPPEAFEHQVRTYFGILAPGELPQKP